MRIRLRAEQAVAAIVHRAAACRTLALAIIGAPNYERYCDHARRVHPRDPLLTREEFYRRQLERRYNRPGTRCC